VSSDGTAEVVGVKWYGDSSVELTYKIPANGKVGSRLLYRTDEPNLEVLDQGLPWSFDGDGYLFRLVSEAQRIRLAHLFDPLLAVHTSIVEPLPHQITAVYESMLGRQPLRFLLADDPGAGKTIMAGLLIKELVARGDLERCLVVCPGSLVEQWQDELYRRFQLPFEIMTNDKLETARTGNWFSETPLAIARLDQLARNEKVQALLRTREDGWDLVICDEAHKMSASFFGGEVRYTKRYRLGQMLSTRTRHFLLLTATPHNGKEQDFQLFMALLDSDRFEGRFRDGVHTADVSDLMRRMVKERLFKFDATPLFPERCAYAVPYKLSEGETCLYQEVTSYVRDEFNRAEALQNDKRAGTVGFALTILQRRLASSPEAIYQSLRRRKERLQNRLRELRLLQRGSQVEVSLRAGVPEWTDEDIEELEDAPDDEVVAAEEEILDRATAARTVEELDAEIQSLQRLEALAGKVRTSGEDKKWKELADLLNRFFTDSPIGNREAFAPSAHQKLVVFTEYRDTLNYLHQRITTLLGREEAVVMIHGGIRREDRRVIQESFLHDPEVKILLANDAASEGINLQRAHLMVNYDLPWNPNRIEQRFGRIHRIGQMEVCHLWNLIAEETREGDVYHTLLDKLEEARKALGGQVFDVLGKVQFGGKPLRDLLLEAVRYGESPEVRARLTKTVSDAFDKGQVQDLLSESALVQNSMDTSQVLRVREEMERAEARRLQPHYIESFFIEAFRRLGGKITEREHRRYQVTHVPAKVRDRDRLIGLGEPVLRRYERVTFEKSLMAPTGQLPAVFICPGHPLLDATIDLTLERHRDLLRQSSVLVDDNDDGDQPRVLVYLEHCIQDGSRTRSGEQRTVSKRMLHVEVDADLETVRKDHAPYLDYRPLDDDEPTSDEVVSRPECSWIGGNLETKAVGYAISNVVPEHLDEVQSRKLEHLSKTEAAVKERLTKEIAYWDHRAADLQMQEKTGKPNARLNSAEARRRADDLQVRLQKRMDEIQRERQLSPLPPVVLGGVLVVPAGLLRKMRGEVSGFAPRRDTQAAAARARAAVVAVERGLGFEPVDRELDKLGYDIESRVPGTGKLRFIEVKGRVQGAPTVTVTRNEVLTSLNKPEDYILAIVEFQDDGTDQVHYVRYPFQREPDFGATSINYDLPKLLARAEVPA
jgi:superfamily II DNA or RNA helicase